MWFATATDGEAVGGISDKVGIVVSFPPPQFSIKLNGILTKVLYKIVDLWVYSEYNNSVATVAIILKTAHHALPMKGFLRDVTVPCAAFL
jgi:hypothetical protein